MALWKVFLAAVCFANIIQWTESYTAPYNPISLTNYERCHASFCNYEGRCYISKNEQQCACYKQYYEGPKCLDSVGNCGKTTLGMCSTDGTRRCYNYLGNMMCICKEGYVGYTCDEFIGKKFQHAQYPAIYFLHQQVMNTDLSCFVLSGVMNDTIEFIVDINGFRYKFHPNDFKTIDNEALALFDKVFTYEKRDGQIYYIKLSSPLLTPKLFNVRLSTITGNVGYVDYHFEIDVYRPINFTCLPYVSVKDGSCSPYSDWVPALSQSGVYRLGVYVKPACGMNSTFKISFGYILRNTEHVKYNLTDSTTLLASDIIDADTVFSEEDASYTIVITVTEIPEVVNKVTESNSSANNVFGTRTRTKQNKSREMSKGTAYALCWMQRTTVLPPIAIIEGGTNRSLYYRDNITLVSKSYYPGYLPDKQPKMDLEWTCKCVETKLCPPDCPLFKESSQSLNLGFSFDNITWYNVSEWVELEIQLTVEFTVQNISKKTAASVTLYYFKEKRKALSIRCVRNCDPVVDINELVVLQADCANCLSDDPNYIWLVEHPGLVMSLKLNLPKNMVVYKLNSQNKVTIVVKLNDGSWVGYGLSSMDFFISRSTNSFQENRFRDNTCDTNIPFNDLGLQGSQVCFWVTNDTINLEINYLVMQYTPGYFSVSVQTGVLLTYSNVPSAKGLLIAAKSGSLTKIYSLNCIDQRFDLPLSPMPHEIRRYSAKNFIEYLTNMYNGNGTNRLPMKTVIQLSMVSELVQRMNFIVHELAEMKLESGEWQQIKDNETEIITTFLKDLEVLEITIRLDIIQVLTLLTKIALLQSKPMNADIARYTATRLRDFSVKLVPAVVKDVKCIAKTEGLAYYIKPVVDAVTAIMDYDMSYNDLLISDYMSQLIRKRGIDHIDIQPGEETNTEHYEVYSEFDPGTISYKDAYMYATMLSIETVFNLLESLATTLRIPNNAGSFDNFMPPSQYHGLASWTYQKLYTYVRVCHLKFYHSDHFEIGRVGSAFVRFNKNWYSNIDDKSITYTFNVFITEVNPFWWAISERSYLNMAVVVNIYKNENEPINADIDILFDITSVKVRYLETVVRKHRDVLNSRRDFSSNASIHGMVTFRGLMNKTYPQTCVLFKMPVDEDGRPAIVRAGISIDKALTEEEVMNSSIEIGQNKRISFILPTQGTFLYISVLSSEQHNYSTIHFGVAMYGVSCDGWNNDTLKWMPKGVADNEDFNFYPEGNVGGGSCKYRTENNLMNSIYTLAVQPAQLELTDAMDIFIDYDLGPCYIITITTAILLIVFLFIFCYAMKMDCVKSYQKEAIFLVDNRPDEFYEYIIIVVTGSTMSAGTTSFVGIKLYGSLEFSKRHILHGVKKYSIFQRHTVDWFVLTTSKKLGEVLMIELWTNHDGYAPAWYCETVVVRDLILEKQWVFHVHQWFSLIHSNGTVHRTIVRPPPISKKNKPRYFKPGDWDLHHIWIGMMQREECHTFDRETKVLVCFSITVTAMFAYMFYSGIPELDASAERDLGESDILLLLKNSALALITSACINYPFLYIFKNGPRFDIFDPFKRIFPWCPNVCIIIFWLGYAGFSLCCTAFVMMYGLHFGEVKSYMWLLALVVIIISDVFILEVIHVFVRCWFWRVVLGKYERRNYCVGRVDMNYHSQIKLANEENKTRLLRRKLYQPLSRPLRRYLANREIKFASFKWKLLDLLFLLLFLLILSLRMRGIHAPYAYYNTKTIEELMVTAHYAGIDGLKNISSFQSVWDYLNHTFLHSIFWREPAFFMMPNFELLGIPRLRQIRAKPTEVDCAHVELFEEQFGTSCYIEWDFFNIDTTKYLPKWDKYQISPTYGPRHLDPFDYKTAEDSKSLPYIGPTRIYPEGGYIAYLGRSNLNLRYSLNYLKNNKWVTNLTRALFLEFSAVNSYVNMINVVQLAFEYTPLNTFTTSYKIYTIKMVLVDWISEQQWEVLKQFFIVILVFMTMKHVYDMIKMSPRKYVHDRWMYLYWIVLILSISWIIVINVKFRYLPTLIREILLKRNNVYIDFKHVIIFEYVSKLVASLFILVAVFHGWRLLRINESCRLVEYTIGYAFHSICHVVALLTLSLIALATLCHLTLGRYLECFNTFDKSIGMAISLPFGMFPVINAELGIIGFIFYLFSFFLLKILMLFMCMTIVITSIEKARRLLDKEHNEYFLIDYIRERIFHQPGPGVRFREIAEHRLRHGLLQ